MAEAEAGTLSEDTPPAATLAHDAPIVETELRHRAVLRLTAALESNTAISGDCNAFASDVESQLYAIAPYR